VEELKRTGECDRLYGMGRSKETRQAGTKADVLAKVDHVLTHPNAKLAVKIDPSQTVAQSRVFADGGRRAAVMAYLTRRSQEATFPRTAEEVYDSLEELFVFCTEYKLAPTLGIFAIWNGVTMQWVWRVETEHDDERAHAVSVCKEIIRSFLEQTAIEGDYNPLLYFNAMKSQYGLAESVAVTVRHEDNTSEITPDEYRERVTQLTKGSDGVYRESG
jgi:hypothetical protein